MTSGQPSEASIFNSARKIAATDEREAFLAEACGDDHALRQRVEKLLAAFAEESQFLEQPAPELEETRVPDAAQNDRSAALDAELDFSFDAESAVVIGDANHSVLRSLDNTLAEVSRIALRESKTEGDAPLMRPNSREMPERDSDSRYRLDGEIARGGMGAILKGRDIDLGRDLAIKVLLDAHKDKPDVVQRFIEEAQIGGQLQHPGIAPIYELGQFADKRPFFAMKLVKGQTLSKLLADRDDAADERGKLIGIFEQICHTVAYAHSRGVIHRDLKPANIMVGAFGEVQVMDWGLAKVLQVGGVADERKSMSQQGQSIIQTLRSGVGSDVSNLGSVGSVGSHTQMGSVMGTPAYMPPEQALGEIDQMDERADVFGLGAILCQILTGQPPYVAKDGRSVFRLASRGKLEDAFSRLDVCGADEDLIALTKHCLELEPVDRPRDAGMLAERITGYLESVEAKLRESELERASEAARADAEAAQANAERQRAEAESLRAEAESARAGEEIKRRRTSLALAASVLLLAGLGSVGWMYMERQEASRQTAQATAHRLHATEMETLAEQRDDQRKAADSARQNAEQERRTAVAAKLVAEAAEQKGRQLLYSTDMQLIGTLLKAEQSSAREILNRLNAHDPDSPENVTAGQDLRGFEWHYFQRLVDSRSKIFSGFQRDVVASAVTSEGELITLDSGGQVQAFNAETRQPIRREIDLCKGRDVGAMAMSRDGRRVALAFGDQVYLFDPASGEQIASPITAITRRHGLLFSPDGQMLITVNTGVGWWDVTTGRLIAERDVQLQVPTNNKWLGRAHSVSQDGLVLCVGGQSKGTACNTFSAFKLNKESGEISQLLDKAGGSGGTMNSIVISPDGQFIAVGFPWSGNLAIFEVASGKKVQSHPGAHATDVRQIAFNFGGRQMVTASTDGTVKVWEDFLKLESYRVPEDDGREITGVTNLLGHTAQIGVLSFFDGGKKVLSASQDKTVRTWDLANRKQTLDQPIAGTKGGRGRFSPDGSLMAFSGDRNGIQLRDGDKGNVVATFPPRDDGVVSQSVAFSPDNRLLAVGYGGQQSVSEIELWDIGSREKLAVLPGSTSIEGFKTTNQTGRVIGLAFSPDGRQLVASVGTLNHYPASRDISNYPLLVYDVDSAQLIRQLKGHRNYCVAVTFSSDGTRMASASYDGTARVWDTETWKELRVLRQDARLYSEVGLPRVLDVAFSPNGEMLASASGEHGDVIVWDVESGAEFQLLKGHSSMVRGITFSPDGRTLASASMDGTVRLWNTNTWRELIALDLGTIFVATSLAFSNDGNSLLAGNGGGNALIWSTASEEAALSLNVHQLSGWLEAGVDFQRRVRMLPDHLQLHELLTKMPPQHLKNPLVQAALAASRSNWHAYHGRWADAAKEYQHVREIDSDTSCGWFRTPGLIRIAQAVLEEGNPTAAAELVAATSHQMDSEGIKSSNRIGMLYSRTFPIRLTEVMADTPASNAGLLAGDIISQVNDVELTEDNLGQISKLLAGEPGTTLRLTIQHAGSDQQNVIELTKAKSFSVPSLDTQLAGLRTKVQQQLTATPPTAGLLELRAELNGLVQNAETQIADYTSAIAMLKIQPTATIEADLQRLHLRRGNAYVGIEKWQEAIDDYEIGITANISDEELLANQALARANVLLDKPWSVLQPQPHEMKSEGGAELTLQADGSILASGKNPNRDAYQITTNVGLKRITAIQLEVLPDPSLPGNGPGRYPSNGNFNLNELRVLVNGTPHKPAGVVVSYGNTEQHRDIIDGTIDGNCWGIYPRSGERHFAMFTTDLELAADDKLTLELVSSRGKYRRHNLGRFRLSVSDDPSAYEHAENRFTALKQTDPWTKLAVVYHHIDDQQALDRLLEQHPQALATLADLYERDEDWQRAIDTYGSLITDQTTDVNLFSKRAAAYIATEQWDLASADWLRVVDQQPKKLQQAFGVFRKTEQWRTAAEFGLLLVEQQPNQSYQWMTVAPFVYLADQNGEYSEFCSRLVKHFSEADNSTDAERILKLLLLRGNIQSKTAQHLGAVISRSLESNTAPNKFDHLQWGSLALLAHRNGDPDLAVKYLVKSAECSPTELSQALNMVVLALAQQEPDNARNSLKEASQLIACLKEDPANKGHHMLLIAEILYREAEAKINGQADSTNPESSEADELTKESTEANTDQAKRDDG